MCERNLEVLIDHLIDGDRAGGVEELIHVHLRVPLRGPVLLLQLYGRLQQGLGSVVPGLFGIVGSGRTGTQKNSQLQIRFLYQQFSSSFKINKRTLDLCFKKVLISVPDLDPKDS
jgi:hypothetical protein